MSLGRRTPSTIGRDRWQGVGPSKAAVVVIVDIQWHGITGSGMGH